MTRHGGEIAKSAYDDLRCASLPSCVNGLGPVGCREYDATSAYALSDHPELAEQRRQTVVGQMVKYGYLSEEEGERLKEV